MGLQKIYHIGAMFNTSLVIFFLPVKIVHTFQLLTNCKHTHRSMNQTVSFYISPLYTGGSHLSQIFWEHENLAYQY